MSDRDPRCGCPLSPVAANRADRRWAAKRGRTVVGVAVHRDGCYLRMESSRAVRQGARKASRK